MKKESVSVPVTRLEWLDGLRGVAALAVLVYHIFEAMAFSQNLEIERMAQMAGVEPQLTDQHFFHGFLAVDFFFILSGFVMGYAYDGRWKKMSVGQFFCRRLIRLHPMVVAGTLVGVVAFCLQGCVKWDGTQVSLSVLMLGTLLTLFMLPSPTALDVRGNTESFSLNGPFWSLFFEYVGSLLYALMLCRMSTKWLKGWVLVAFVLLLLMGTWGPDGSVAMGWSSNPLNMLGGLLRMAFAYPAGLLLARLYREREFNGSAASSRFKFRLSPGLFFLLASVVLTGLMGMPNVGWLNPCYEVCCIAFVFTAIVWITARQSAGKSASNGFVGYIGRLSYPLYACHYPLIYLYIDWINRDVHPFGNQAWSSPIAIFVSAIGLGTFFLLCYDEPLRRYLQKKILKR